MVYTYVCAVCARLHWSPLVCVLFMLLASYPAGRFKSVGKWLGCKADVLCMHMCMRMHVCQCPPRNQGVLLRSFDHGVNVHVECL